MRDVRTIPDGGYLTAGANTVIQHEGVNHVLVPANAFRDTYFMVMNMTNSSIAIQVERDEFPIDYSGTNCTSAVLPAWAQAYVAITFDPNRGSLVAQIAGFISDTKGDPTPEGDWLPVENPKFEGTISGQEINLVGYRSQLTFNINEAMMHARDMRISVATGSHDGFLDIDGYGTRFNCEKNIFKTNPTIASQLDVSELDDMTLITVAQVKQLIAKALTTALGKNIKL